MPNDHDDVAGWSDKERRACEVLAAYFEAETGGHAPRREELIGRHPDLAAELRDFLDQQDHLLSLTSPLRPSLDEPEDDADDEPRNDPEPDSEAEILAADSAPHADLPAGLAFGPDDDFLVLGEIARGGMGVVYRAWQRSLDRPVALKVLLAGRFASAGDVRRFQREAEALAQLDHPNIVPVYEIGRREGVIFFAMKLFEGGSLAEHIDDYADDPRAAATLVALVARGIHHAHQRGVLHRDVKPSNVLLDAQGRPAVSDLGLAKRADGDPLLTQTGALLGTPAYMAPELADGDRTAVTTATDIYGLGAVLFTLLAGRPPFEGDSLLRTLDNVRSRPPAFPRRSGPPLHRDLATVCLTCLQKDPARRYPTAAALADDLDLWLRGEPIRARPPGPLEVAFRWAARRRAAVSAVAAAALAVVLLGVAARQSQVLRRNEALALQHARDARQNRYANDLRLAHHQLRSGLAGRAASLLERQAPGPAGPPADDLRGFEWGYLHRLLHSEQATLNGHRGDVYHAEFSPDGATLVSCGQDRTARLWDVASLSQVALLNHPNEVNWVTFAPDGKSLATAGDDGTVRLWDFPSGRPRAAFPAGTLAVVAVVFSPDGRSLIAGGKDRKLRRWDLATSREVAVWDAGVDEIESLATAAHAPALAASGRARAVRLFDPRSGAPLAQFAQAEQREQLRSVAGVALSRDGSLLAATAEGARANLWAANGQRLAVLYGHHGQVLSLAFAPDGKALATTGRDASLRLWDLPSGAPRYALNGHADRVWSVAFAPDGKALATASRDGTLKLWDALRRPDRTPLAPAQGSLASLAFSPAGDRLAAVDLGGNLSTWDAATGALLATARPAGAEPQPRARIAPGARLLSHYDELSATVIVHRLDAPPDAPSLRLPIPGGRAGDVAFSDDATRLVTAAREGIAVWDLATGQVLQRLEVPFRLDPNTPANPAIGARVVIACPAGPTSESWVASWDTATGTPLARRYGGPSVRKIALSPDANTLAIVRDNEFELWDVATLNRRAALVGHTDSVNALAFSPDGKSLASGSSDKTVRLWTVASGQELFPLEGHSGPVFGLRFSDDGLSLASAADSLAGASEIFLWHAASLKP